MHFFKTPVFWGFFIVNLLVFQARSQKSSICAQPLSFSCSALSAFDTKERLIPISQNQLGNEQKIFMPLFYLSTHRT